MGDACTCGYLYNLAVVTGHDYRSQYMGRYTRSSTGSVHLFATRRQCDGFIVLRVGLTLARPDAPQRSHLDGDESAGTTGRLVRRVSRCNPFAPSAVIRTRDHE